MTDLNKYKNLNYGKEESFLPELPEEKPGIGFMTLLQSGSKALKEGEDKYLPTARAGLFMLGEEVFKTFTCQVIDVQNYFKVWFSHTNRPSVYLDKQEAEDALEKATQESIKRNKQDPKEPIISGEVKTSMDFLIRIIDKDNPCYKEVTIFSFDLQGWAKKMAAIKWMAELSNFTQETGKNYRSASWIVSSRLDKSKKAGENFSWYSVTMELGGPVGQEFYEEAEEKLTEVKALMAGKEEGQEDVLQLAESHGI